MTALYLLEQLVCFQPRSYSRKKTEIKKMEIDASFDLTAYIPEDDEIITYDLDVYLEYSDILDNLLDITDDFNITFKYYYPSLSIKDIANPNIQSITIVKQGNVAFVPANLPHFQAEDRQLDAVMMMLFEHNDIHKILFEDYDVWQSYKNEYVEEESIFQTQMIDLNDK